MWEQLRHQVKVLDRLRDEKIQASLEFHRVKNLLKEEESEFHTLAMRAVIAHCKTSGKPAPAASAEWQIEAKKFVAEQAIFVILSDPTCKQLTQTYLIPNDSIT